MEKENKITKNIFLITEENDKSTNRLIDWISILNQDFKRKNVNINYNRFSIKLENHIVKNSFDDDVVWNRRGYLSIVPIQLNHSIWIDYLKKEQLPVLETLENVNKENYLGSYFNEIRNNKIQNLIEASKIGLEIPKTIITNNKEDLSGFFEKEKKYVTKSIYHSPSLELDNFIYYGKGTFLIDTDCLSDFFAPSLIQEYIEKEIEIRVFFIEDSFYPMAIFSQNDEKTKTDYRNYNNEKPNRNVPFILPNNILKKIKKFVKKIKYNTGSIDLILTPDGRYVFLEINPMGQYDWVSQNCNYYIDKKIAEILINKSKKWKKK